MSESEHATPEDIVAHCGDDYDGYLGAISPPIFQNSLFTRKRGDLGYSYTRTSNPTVEVAEKKIAALEGGDMAVCFSSGMAAITAAIVHYLEAGAHVVAPASIYPPARMYLERYVTRFKVETTFVTGLDVAEIEAAIRTSTQLIYLESPASGIFELQDLRAIAQLARPKGIPTVVDNSWATPIFQRPAERNVMPLEGSAVSASLRPGRTRDTRPESPATVPSASGPRHRAGHRRRASWPER